MSVVYLLYNSKLYERRYIYVNIRGESIDLFPLELNKFSNSYINSRYKELRKMELLLEYQVNYILLILLY